MNKHLLLLWLLLISITGYTQRHRIDSILKVLPKPATNEERTQQLYTLAFQMADIKPDSAIMFGKQAVQLSYQTKNDTIKAASLNSLGWAFYRGVQYDSAQSCFLKGIELYHKLGIKSDEGRVRLNLVTLFETRKNFEKALSYALPLTALYESEKDEMAKAFTEKEIGVIYREMKQFDKAKTYLQNALSDFNAIGNEDMYMNTLPSLASLYLIQNQFDSALVYYRKVLLYKQKNRDINTAFATENMGEVFFDMADQTGKPAYADSALNYYQQAKSIFEKNGSLSDVAYEEINLGKCLRILKRYTEAVKYLAGSLAIFKKSQETEYQFNAAKELSETYKSMGNYNLAFDYLVLSNNYKDTMDERNNKEKIAAMFAQYETDKKDRTILLLNTQQKLDQQQISRQHIITLFIASFTLLGIFTALILWNRKNIKQRLGEVEMRNQLSSDLHDDIGSSLSSILLLSNMAAQNKEDEGMRNKLLEKINSNAKEMIERMGDIVWTMNPRYDEGDSLRERIENYTSRLQEITPVTIQTNVDKSIEHYHFSMELRKNIFLIIKEAVNNALKYAEATLITLELTVANNCFALTINDNGTGFNPAAKPNGNGLETMIQRAKASGGNCIVTSSPGNGTVVKAVMPIPNIR